MILPSIIVKIKYEKNNNYIVGGVVSKCGVPKGCFETGRS
jgi:hypothetical protein